MKNILFIILFVFSYNSYSQDISKTKLIIEKYVQELNLDNEKAEKFKEIMIRTGEILYKEEITGSDFNKELKNRQLQLVELLGTDDFEKYLKYSSEIEPNIKYRFD
jgi:hypothetical protein